MILLVVLASQIPYFISLDIPKTIVNKAIQGGAFQKVDGKVVEGATAAFLKLELALPKFLGGGSFVLFPGIALEQVAFLLAWSGMFLLMVIVNNGFKFQLNTMKGRVGERLLRRMRYQLFDRILRFPLPHFRKVKPAEMATMIKDEVEPIGGFVGEAYATPAFLGGQALTALLFITLENFWLSLVAIAVISVQLGIIPKLRKRVLVLGRERQLTARQLAGRVAEVVDGIREVRANNTSNFERADVASRLGRIYNIRFEIYQRKFAVKALNNFLAQVTPFVFYSLGGYLALTGELSVGALLAVVVAYKDLPGPLKELLDWDQQRMDIQIKYEQVVQQFNPERMLDPAAQAIDAGRDAPLAGALTAVSLSYADDTGVKLVDNVSFSINLADHLAVIGSTGGGKTELGMLAAGLLKPTGGSVTIGDLDVGKSPEAVTGRRIGYVGPETYLFPSSVLSNILYGLSHRPAERSGEMSADEIAERDSAIAESRRTGNAEFDRAADWLNYQAAGVANMDELLARVTELLKLVDFEKEIYEFGFRGNVSPQSHPKLVDSILSVRKSLRQKLDDPKFANLVEPFDRLRFNRNGTLGENLIFGKATGRKFNFDLMAENAYVKKVLDDTKLSDQLVEIGQNMAATTIEMFADLPPGHEFFDQFSFIGASDLPEYKGLLARTREAGIANLTPADRGKYISLSFKLVPERHRLGFVDDALQERFLEARKLFAQDIPDNLKTEVEFFDADKFAASATVMENIVFGKVAYGVAQAEQRVYALIGEVLDQFGQRKAVIEAGLDFQVGVGGSRLASGQKQKLGLMRALLKRPDLLVLNELTASLDSAAQKTIMDGIVAEMKGRGLVWVLHRADFADRFAHTLVVKDSKIVEQGKTVELMREGTRLHDLIKAA